MKKIVKKRILNIILFCIMIMLSSCKPVEIPNSVVNVPEWSKGMVMIIVAEEKNVFEKAFNKEIWNLKSVDEKESYEQYIIDNVKNYVQKLMIVNLMLDESLSSPSAEERALIEKTAEEYYNSLTDADKLYIGCTEEEVYKLYIEYFKARNIANMLIQGADDDISVSEAKVIGVEQIKLDSREKANEIREKVKQSGASFSYYAKQYSKDTLTSFEVARGTKMAVDFPELFFLNTGDISDVIESKGFYYIFKCTNGYKEKETLNRRDEMIKAIRQKTFDEQFEEFQKEHRVVLKAKYWSDISLSKENKCTACNFYDTFKKYFGEK